MYADVDSKVLAGRYELAERIGGGGMGNVWRAHDTTLGRDVAVKLLHEGLAADATFVARFRSEARAAAKLTHPNVVAVYDTGTHEGIPFIVMELVVGESVHGLISRVGPLPVEETARIARGILSAIAHAHDRGLIHRDVKPANVIMDESSLDPKVADFGIAKGLEDTGGLTRTSGLIGTAAYLSPEQVSGRPATPASDLYAVGCLLYACLSGDPPFGGATPVAVAMRHLHDRVPPLRDRRPDVPPDFEAVINRALEKDPARRFGSASEMARAVAATGLGAGPAPTVIEAVTLPVGPGVGTAPLPVRPPTERIRRPKPPPSPAGRILATLTAVLIAAAAVWLVLMALPDREPVDTQPALPTLGPTLAPSTPVPTEAPTPSPIATPSTSGNVFICGLPGFPDCSP
jgi:serine/threonine-protein kinase